MFLVKVMFKVSMNKSVFISIDMKTSRIFRFFVSYLMYNMSSLLPYLPSKVRWQVRSRVTAAAAKVPFVYLNPQSFVQP